MANENPELTNEEAAEVKPLKVFLTGASSGIGRVITRLLVKHGIQVIGASETGSAGAAHIREDGALPSYPDLTRAGEIVSILQMSQTDIIVHAAGQVLNGPPQIDAEWASKADWLRESTEAVVAAAGQAGVKKIIFLSIAAAYGDQHGAAVNESKALASRSNAFYKAIAAAEAAILDGGVQGYVLRVGTLIGAYSETMVKLSEQLRGSKGVVPGPGLSAWVQEDDLADAVLRLIQRDSSNDALSNVYNIAMTQPASPDQFINAFGEALGVGTPSRSGFDLHSLLFGEEPVRSALLKDSLSLDSSQAHTVLGWQPQFTSLAAAIERALLVWRASEAPLLLPASVEETTGKELAIR